MYFLGPPTLNNNVRQLTSIREGKKKHYQEPFSADTPKTRIFPLTRNSESGHKTNFLFLLFLFGNLLA